jgi:hypothetical protein
MRRIAQMVDSQISVGFFFLSFFVNAGKQSWWIQLLGCLCLRKDSTGQKMSLCRALLKGLGVLQFDRKAICMSSCWCLSIDCRSERGSHVLEHWNNVGRRVGAMLRLINWPIYVSSSVILTFLNAISLSFFADS